ncbi:MAG: MFS transporter, partial [Myxococcota bacterium]
EVLYAYALVASAMVAGFMIFPNIAAYVVFNLGYPRSELEILFAVGGVVSLVGMQIAGRLCDRIGAFRVGSVAVLVVVIVMYFLFAAFEPGWPLVALFATFMLFMSVRAVAQNTLTSQVPLPHERARFMSLESATRHFASSTGAILGSLILVEGEGRALEGLPELTFASSGFLLLIPPLLWILESRVRANQAASRIPVVAESVAR